MNSNGLHALIMRRVYRSLYYRVNLRSATQYLWLPCIEMTCCYIKKRNKDWVWHGRINCSCYDICGCATGPKQIFRIWLHAVFIDLNDALPEDVILVILNAYNVWFFHQVETILKQNVATMPKNINECNLYIIWCIYIVSTSYVQPPEPYKCPDQNCIPFFLE